MNVWMKRGLQSALLTGGLLAAGSGIASADDSLDVAVPVTVTDNALAVLGTSPGTPAPEIVLPAVDGPVTADLGPATVSVPVAIGGNSADAAGLDVAQPAAAPAPSGGNGSVADADVPVTATGNAIAVLGDATASDTAGTPAAAGSSASAADADVPVTACGTGLAVLGGASGSCTTPATAGSSTAGTTPVIGADAPITACGTGIALLGDATSTCTAAAGNGDAVPVDPTVTPTGPAFDVSSGDFGDFGDTLTSSGGITPGTSLVRSLVTSPATSAGTGAGTGARTSTVTAPADTVDTGPGSLAWTGTELALALIGGLLALFLGLALSVRTGRRDASLT